MQRSRESVVLPVPATPGLAFFGDPANRRDYGWTESPEALWAFYEKDRLAKERQQSRAEERLLLERTGLPGQVLEEMLVRHRAAAVAPEREGNEEIQFGGTL